MIILVDNELEEAYDKPWGERLLAGRTKIKYLLEDLSALPCLLVRYSHVTPSLLSKYDAKALFVSGNSALPTEYNPELQTGLVEIFQAKSLPIFAFCGSFQLLAETYGAELGTMGEVPEQDILDDPNDFAPHLVKEMGYLPAETIHPHPLLESLSDPPIFRQAHSWEVKTVPPGFTNYLSTDITQTQMIVHDTHPIVGTQFHPEYPTAEHPDGRILIQNFLRWANII